MSPKVSRKDLIQDIREINHLIESSHPDPYFKGGGKIAYHRRLQTLIRDIPPDGLTPFEFLFHLMPFFARIKDGHTLPEFDRSLFDKHNPGGLPFIFGAVEGQLYIKAVFHEEHKPWFGSLLLSIQGVPLDEIIERVANFIPCENRYQALGMLGSNWAVLMLDEVLKRLIPEWDGGKISISLHHPDGNVREHKISPAKDLSYPFIRNQIPSHLPPLTDPDNEYIFFHFFDPQEVNGQSTALLRVANMMNYREGYELALAQGNDFFKDIAREVYQKYKPDDPPEEDAQVLAGIPSATDIFIDLFKRMKAQKTKYLIVDLRNNMGGFSVINQIFSYFLVGFEKTLEIQGTNGTVTRYSAFRDGENNTDHENTLYTDWAALEPTDFDFSLDPAFIGDRLEAAVRDEFLGDFEKTPSFSQEFQTRHHEAYYRPEKLFVLSSELTFSSGFNLMTDLYKLGGVIVGVPSSAAGNSCGDIRSFTLSNSKLEGAVSTRAFTAFEDDPDKGKLLEPHHPLTYEKFKSYDFDENASLRYVLEIIKDTA